MIRREFFSIAASNLWRMKLRSILTICGVIIANGALVAMLAIASGMQKNVIDTFNDLNLFHTIHVLPPLIDTGNNAAASDSTTSSPLAGLPLPKLGSRSGATLDEKALAEILALNEVVHIYPQDTFDATITLETGEMELVAGNGELTAQALPVSFIENRDVGLLLAGRFYKSDDAREVVLSRRTASRLGLPPDSLVGRTVHFDVVGRGQLVSGLFQYFFLDLNLPETLKTELRKPAVQKTIDNLLRRFMSISGESEIDLTVCGVADVASGWGFRLRDALIPTRTAAGLDRIGFSDPIELLANISSGGGEGYSLAVVTISEGAQSRAVRDSIEAMGWRTFDFLEQFSEMKKAFLVFDALMAVFGLVALIIASLGIINTMIMSILDRKREIGILKSLGAQDHQIRLLFLVESGLIGLIGSLGGILLGWSISRIASFFLKRYMESNGTPVAEMFYFPLWLIGGAFVFGVAISLLAGSYPAARAARIDPVEALRGE